MFKEQKHCQSKENVGEASSLLNTHDKARNIKGHKSSFSENVKKKRIIDSVGMLLQNLSFQNDDVVECMDSDNVQGGEKPSQNNSQGASLKASSNNCYTNSSLDSCNTRRIGNHDNDGDKPHDEKPITLKRRYFIYFFYS